MFVCHGNICRSPMAEFVMKDLVKRAGLAERLHVESAATSDEEIGNPPHRGTRQCLKRAGINCEGKRARRIVKEDYKRFDYLVGMDRWTEQNMRRFFDGDPDGKVSRLLEFAGRPGADVDDPWYTGDFEATWQNVLVGCQGLLKTLTTGRCNENGSQIAITSWTPRGKNLGHGWSRRIYP